MDNIARQLSDILFRLPGHFSLSILEMEMRANKAGYSGGVNLYSTRYNPSSIFSLLCEEIDANITTKKEGKW